MQSYAESVQCLTNYPIYSKTIACINALVATLALNNNIVEAKECVPSSTFKSHRPH